MKRQLIEIDKHQRSLMSSGSMGRARPSWSWTLEQDARPLAWAPLSVNTRD